MRPAPARQHRKKISLRRFYETVTRDVDFVESGDVGEGFFVALYNPRWVARRLGIKSADSLQRVLGFFVSIGVFEKPTLAAVSEETSKNEGSYTLTVRRRLSERELEDLQSASKGWQRRLRAAAGEDHDDQPPEEQIPVLQGIPVLKGCDVEESMKQFVVEGFDMKPFNTCSGCALWDRKGVRTDPRGVCRASSVVYLTEAEDSCPSFKPK